MSHPEPDLIMRMRTGASRPIPESAVKRLMPPPSMEEAAKIRDVAARHAYVFDNGLSSRDFFDVEKRMASEEFGLLRERIARSDSVLEIGCFTGLNLLGLAQLGCGWLIGVDFVNGAIEWLNFESEKRGANIGTVCDDFPDGRRLPMSPADRIICFDVLEHQRNPGRFLDGVEESMAANGRALFLVPVGREFFDCGHVAFFPDAECLHNVLDYVFEVEEIFELKTCRKLFASCRRRA